MPNFTTQTTGHKRLKSEFSGYILRAPVLATSQGCCTHVTPAKIALRKTIPTPILLLHPFLFREQQHEPKKKLKQTKQLN